MQLHWLSSEMLAFGDGTFSASIQVMGSQTRTTLPFLQLCFSLSFHSGSLFARSGCVWESIFCLEIQIPIHSLLCFRKGVEQL